MLKVTLQKLFADHFDSTETKIQNPLPFFTCIILFPQLFARGFVCVPGSGLVNGRLSPSDTGSQNRSCSLIFYYSMC